MYKNNDSSKDNGDSSVALLFPSSFNVSIQPSKNWIDTHYKSPEKVSLKPQKNYGQTLLTVGKSKSRGPNAMHLKQWKD